jgi:hypothetical protein
MIYYVITGLWEMEATTRSHPSQKRRRRRERIELL